MAPVILFGDSIVPLKVTVRPGFLLSAGGLSSQLNAILFPFTVPVIFCVPIFVPSE